MQIERLTALACWLEGGAKHKLKIGERDVIFDMANGIKVLAGVGEDFNPASCSTACCIAGAAVEFFEPQRANELLAGVREEAQPFIDGEVYNTDEDPNRAAEIWNFDAQTDFYDSVGPLAQKILELDDTQAMQLFTPTHYYAEFDHLQLRDFSDPAWAARTIRYGLETGNFDWRKTQ